jgi:hypothetical protein
MKAVFVCKAKDKKCCYEKERISSWEGEYLPLREHGKAQGAFTSRELSANLKNM